MRSTRNFRSLLLFGPLLGACSTVSTVRQPTEPRLPRCRRHATANGRTPRSGGSRAPRRADAAQRRSRPGRKSRRAPAQRLVAHRRADRRLARRVASRKRSISRPRFSASHSRPTDSGCVRQAETPIRCTVSDGRGDSAVLADSIALGAAQRARRAGTRYPAQLAFSPDGRRLYVAENLADSLAVIDMASGAIVQRLMAGRYPYGVVVAPDGTRLRLGVGRRDSSPRIRAERRVAVACRVDCGRATSVGAAAQSIRLAPLRRLGEHRPRRGDRHEDWPTRCRASRSAARRARRGQHAERARALSRRNATVRRRGRRQRGRGVRPVDSPAASDSLGRVPTGWYPAALAVAGSSLLVANGKGSGTHANPDGPGPREVARQAGQRKERYARTAERHAVGARRDVARTLAPCSSAVSARVARANGWSADAASGTLSAVRARDLRHPREPHVRSGARRPLDRPTAIRRSSTSGATVTPNAHAIAERFGAFDRFFVNAEVSADGHNWTTAAYATDYVEKTVQPNYSRARTNLRLRGDESRRHPRGRRERAGERLSLDARRTEQRVAAQLRRVRRSRSVARRSAPVDSSATSRSSSATRIPSFPDSISTSPIRSAPTSGSPSWRRMCSAARCRRWRSCACRTTTRRAARPASRRRAPPSPTTIWRSAE